MGVPSWVTSHQRRQWIFWVKRPSTSTSCVSMLPVATRLWGRVPQCLLLRRINPPHCCLPKSSLSFFVPTVNLWTKDPGDPNPDCELPLRELPLRDHRERCLSNMWTVVVLVEWSCSAPCCVSNGPEATWCRPTYHESSWCSGARRFLPSCPTQVHSVETRNLSSVPGLTDPRRGRSITRLCCSFGCLGDFIDHPLVTPRSRCGCHCRPRTRREGTHGLHFGWQLPVRDDRDPQLSNK